MAENILSKKDTCFLMVTNLKFMPLYGIRRGDKEKSKAISNCPMQLQINKRVTGNYAATFKKT